MSTRGCGSGAVAKASARPAPVSGAENLSPSTKMERFSLALWFAKPLALVRRRWKDRGVRLACQTYVNGPVEVVGVLGAGGKEAREAAGIE